MINGFEKLCNNRKSIRKLSNKLIGPWENWFDMNKDYI